MTACCFCRVELQLGDHVMRYGEYEDGSIVPGCETPACEAIVHSECALDRIRKIIEGAAK